MMWGFSSSLSIAFYYYRLLTRLYLLARCIDKRRLFHILRPVLCARLARWSVHAKYLKCHFIYYQVRRLVSRPGVESVLLNLQKG